MATGEEKITDNLSQVEKTLLKQALSGEKAGGVEVNWTENFSVYYDADAADRAIEMVSLLQRVFPVKIWSTGNKLGDAMLILDHERQPEFLKLSEAIRQAKAELGTEHGAEHRL